MSPIPLRFLLDEHLSRTAAEGLRRLAIDAVHVTEGGLAGRTDAALFQAAGTDGRIIVTRDHRDFLSLAAHARGADRPMPGLLLVPASIPQTDPGAPVRAIANWIHTRGGAPIGPGGVAWLPAAERDRTDEPGRSGRIREGPPAYQRALRRLAVPADIQPPSG
jgi:hypothetical protein